MYVSTGSAMPNNAASTDSLPGRPGTSRIAGASTKPIARAATTWIPAARMLLGAIRGRHSATHTASVAEPATNSSRNVSLVISPLSRSQSGTELPLAKEVSFGGHDEVASRPRAAHFDAANDRCRNSRRLAENQLGRTGQLDRKSTRLNSSHGYISYAVF